ncbi:MAG TPA: hypothetical protein PLX89_01840 [Verrucomicrobiota bacterium]|nr:hypothetical protein [Verrucomicrobiales bacterium]HRI11719.1 hypothetical protein [Verrucomicrobiota bacterium]
MRNAFCIWFLIVCVLGAGCSRSIKVTLINKSGDDIYIKSASLRTLSIRAGDTGQFIPGVDDTIDFIVVHNGSDAAYSIKGLAVPPGWVEGKTSMDAVLHLLIDEKLLVYILRPNTDPAWSMANQPAGFPLRPRSEVGL